MFHIAEEEGRFRLHSVTAPSLDLVLLSRHSQRGDPGSSYLLPIGVSENIAAHDVNDIWFRIDFTHQTAQPLPEAGRNKINHLEMYLLICMNNHMDV